METKFPLPEPTSYLTPKGIKLKPDAEYAWFPVKGDSMTDAQNKYSIPTGSIVLARKIEAWDAWDYPYKTPVLIMGELNGRPYSVCKTITCVDTAMNYAIQCTSYNKEHKPFWLPINGVCRIFLIEQIKRPGIIKAVNVIHDYNR